MFYLIRHGATQLSSEDRFSGGTDVELSDTGRWQAQLLSERLAAPLRVLARGNRLSITPVDPAEWRYICETLLPPH